MMASGMVNIMSSCLHGEGPNYVNNSLPLCTGYLGVACNPIEPRFLQYAAGVLDFCAGWVIPGHP